MADNTVEAFASTADVVLPIRQRITPNPQPQNTDSTATGTEPRHAEPVVNTAELFAVANKTNSADSVSESAFTSRALGENNEHKAFDLHSHGAAEHGGNTEASPADAPSIAELSPQIAMPTSAFIIHHDPASSGSNKRFSYLPLCAEFVSRCTDGVLPAVLTVIPSHLVRIAKSKQRLRSCHAASWPVSGNVLSVEIFNDIICYLSYDDVKSMRLVCKEFEMKVSGAIFSSSVVAFNTDLYDMIDDGSKSANGKLQLARMNKTRNETGSSSTPNRGLRVFQGFGPHIKKFGMSFEVTEEQLADIEFKPEMEEIVSYHGVYWWPIQKRARFDHLAQLEMTADDTPGMKTAFAHLTAVQELGLVLDNGCGYLNGPDQSIHALVFEQPSIVFGHSEKFATDRQTQEANVFWNTLNYSHYSIQSGMDIKLMQFAQKHLSEQFLEGPLFHSRFADRSSWAFMDRDITSPPTVDGTAPSNYSALYTVNVGDAIRQGPDIPGFQFPGIRKTLIPAQLHNEQKEYLLEAGWAQRAFLDCYVLAILDNPDAFANVTKLNMATISSGFLPVLKRPDIWKALPCVDDITLLVRADWRSVVGCTGAAQVVPLKPSEALVHLFQLLQDQVRHILTLRKLKLGWIGGGEHANGVYGRNQHLLPAPITSLEESLSAKKLQPLVVPQLQELILANCWITPVALETLVASHAQHSLKTLVLDSVSLTAHPRFTVDFMTHRTNVWTMQDGSDHDLLGDSDQEHDTDGNNSTSNNHNFHGSMATPVFSASQLGWQIPQSNQHIPHQTPGMPWQDPQPGPRAHWALPNREGCWPELINKISPGPTLDDYRPNLPPVENAFGPEPQDKIEPRPKNSALRTIVFRSCGYATLNDSHKFTQIMFDHLPFTNVAEEIQMRAKRYIDALQTSSDPYLAAIHPNIPNREYEALFWAWGLSHGWPSDLDMLDSEAATFDGCPPGGTGRFSGSIAHDQGHIEPIDDHWHCQSDSSSSIDRTPGLTTSTSPASSHSL